jgi:hypothetical protein
MMSGCSHPFIVWCPRIIGQSPMRINDHRSLNAFRAWAESEQTERSSVRREIMEDYEYTTVIDGLVIRVDKVGGGTLGRRYGGDWRVTVMNGDTFVIDNEIMSTGLSKTHVTVGYMAHEFACDRIEEQS